MIIPRFAFPAGAPPPGFEPVPAQTPAGETPWIAPAPSFTLGSKPSNPPGFEPRARADHSAGETPWIAPAPSFTLGSKPSSLPGFEPRARADPRRRDTLDRTGAFVYNGPKAFQSTGL